MDEKTRPQGHQFRPEIQGVRTIGALLVAIFHIWMSRVSGGVDVFFVVSGFLITGSLFRQMEQTHRIDLMRFWGGLAKRLVPVAAVVLLAIVAAAILWMPATRWRSLTTEVAASAFYLENWQLMRSAVDYLARDSAPSPLQHFWALAVQGQFYLAWPFLILLSGLLARLLKRPLRPVALALLSATFLASIAYSIFATADNQPAAYFNTFARIWEFSIGGLIALATPLMAIGPRWRLIAGWLGLSAIVSCGFILQVSTIFPGYAALWPTLGAALVLIAGTSGSPIGIDRILGAKPFVALGDISYGLYLWHWPVLVFYLILSRETHAGFLAGMGILVVSLVLAYLTAHYLERPIRASTIGAPRSWQALAVGVIALIPVLILAGSLRGYTMWKAPEQSRMLALDDPNYPGAATLLTANPVFFKPGIPVHPGPLGVEKDLPVSYTDGCHQSGTGEAALTCTYGAKQPRKTIALVGGSHAVQWLPALILIAKKQDWQIVTYTKSSCLFSVEIQNASCTIWNQSVIDALRALKPDVIFTTATHVDRKAKSRSWQEIVPDGFLQRWAQLKKSAINVIAIRDTPKMTFQVPECVAMNDGNYAACDSPRASLVLPAESPLATLRPKPPNVDFIDLTEYFCDEKTCFSVIGNLLVYHDKHHINGSYIRSLAPMLEKAILGSRPDLGQPPDQAASAQ